MADINKIHLENLTPNILRRISDANNPTRWISDKFLPAHKIWQDKNLTTKIWQGQLSYKQKIWLPKIWQSIILLVQYLTVKYLPSTISDKHKIWQVQNLTGTKSDRHKIWQAQNLTIVYLTSATSNSVTKSDKGISYKCNIWQAKNLT